VNTSDVFCLFGSSATLPSYYLTAKQNERQLLVLYFFGSFFWDGTVQEKKAKQKFQFQQFKQKRS
jgi:hypothetical protein